jgi:hypothetical protein
MTEYVAEDRKSTVEGNLTRVIKGTYISETDEYILEADEIIFKAGDATIIMNNDSITIKGKLKYQTPEGTVISPESKNQQYGASWQVVNPTDGAPCEGVNVVVVDEETGEIKKDLQAGSDGRTENLTSEKKPENYIVLTGSGEWGTFIEAEDEPVMMDDDDWYDREAEEPGEPGDDEDSEEITDDEETTEEI